MFMHLGGGACNERQRGTDPNLTQIARAPKHSTAPPRPSGDLANYSGQFKNSGTQEFCRITDFKKFRLALHPPASTVPGAADGIA
ncbi:hypothetical protein E2C01_076512 [Portunus trituberculatus]|uniref:Uncharacterized protein n=1 Tax=Portunus trituberculatus TaxID=210409 RepID=A0A5B7INS6_PORTR|nr:hypothetical protein [Portunus trituberculatus]